MGSIPSRPWTGFDLLTLPKALCYHPASLACWKEKKKPRQLKVGCGDTLTGDGGPQPLFLWL